MSHAHKCYVCGKLYACYGTRCINERDTRCEACSLEATKLEAEKDKAFSMVTSVLLICIRQGRDCSDCDRDCALNENRERINRNV